VTDSVTNARINVDLPDEELRGGAREPAPIGKQVIKQLELGSSSKHFAIA
jgi:hypothetical protein